MKFVLLLILIGMVTTAFAQETPNTPSDELAQIDFTIQEIRDELKNSNVASLLLIGISLSIAGIAIIATIWNAKSLKKQTEKIEKDVNARVRPILGRKHLATSKYLYQKDTSGKITKEIIQVNGDVFAFNKEKLMIHFTNTGNLPALFLKKKGYAEIRSGNTENYSKKYSKDETREGAEKFHAMGPNEFYSVDIFWPKDGNNYFDLSRNGKTVYFGLRIWYEDQPESMGTTYVYQIEGHLDKEKLMLDYMYMD